MSTFKTSIPVNVNDALAKLPKRSYVESSKLSADRKTVDIVWGCDDLKTGFTFAVECALEQVSSPPGAAKSKAAVEVAEEKRGKGEKGHDPAKPVVLTKPEVALKPVVHPPGRKR